MVGLGTMLRMVPLDPPYKFPPFRIKEQRLAMNTQNSTAAGAVGPSGNGRLILIVTQEVDPHADLMVLRLERRGIRPFRFHPQSLGSSGRLTVRFDPSGHWEWTLEGPNGRLQSTEIGAVWYRRTFFVKNPRLAPEDAEFAEAETREAALGMLRLTETFWVSHPDALRRAESKPLQLKVAQQVGFRVPRTLITNDPAEFLAFYQQCDGRVIYKPFTQGPLGLGERKAVYTSPVQPEHLQDLDAIHAGPCLFQEHLPKAMDLRVTVIGQEVFPAEIHSQAAEASKTDWRRGDPMKLKHAAHALPAEVQQQCLALVRRLSLQFGAIDLVLTPGGEYIFLEINPSGQFAWIEDLAKLPLIDTLADLLVSKAASGEKNPFPES